MAARQGPCAYDVCHGTSSSSTPMHCGRVRRLRQASTTREPATASPTCPAAHSDSTGHKQPPTRAGGTAVASQRQPHTSPHLTAVMAAAKHRDPKRPRLPPKQPKQPSAHPCRAVRQWSPAPPPAPQAPLTAACDTRSPSCPNTARHAHKTRRQPTKQRRRHPSKATSPPASHALHTTT